MGRGTAWSRAEAALVTANPDLSNEVLSEKLGRSPSAVRNFRKKASQPLVRPLTGWTDEDLAYIGSSLDRPRRKVCEVLGRSDSSVRNARLRHKYAEGLPVRHPSKDKVPRQDLWDRPPGTYTEVIGGLLLDEPDAMDSWLHAHGYGSFSVVFRDRTDLVTLVCVKEA